MKIKIITAISILTVLLTFAALTSCGKTDGSADSGAAATTAQSGSGSSAESGDTTAGEYGTFSSVDPDGNAVTGAVLTGHKLTMINIWGTRCPYCIDEMPDLAKLNTDYADKGFQVLGIVSNVESLDGSTVDADDADTVKSILQTAGAEYVNMVVTQDVYTVFLTDVSAVPTTFFVDENGNKVGKTYLGAKSYDDWSVIIESLLDEVG